METIFVSVVLLALMIPVYWMGHKRGRIEGMAIRVRLKKSFNGKRY